MLCSNVMASLSKYKHHRELGIALLLLLVGICFFVFCHPSSSVNEEKRVTENNTPTTLVSYPGRTFSYSQRFCDNNQQHLHAAAAIGLKNGPATREQVQQKKSQLRHIQSCHNYVIDSLTHSVPYLVPLAAERLNAIGTEFADILQRNDLPHYRFYVTSVLRTKEDIEHLQRTNGNAIKNSAHNYGTTFDIAYMRFERCTDTHNYMTEDNLCLVLAQTLLNQQRAGHIYVKHEKKQACFHITVRS